MNYLGIKSREGRLNFFHGAHGAQGILTANGAQQGADFRLVAGGNRSCSVPDGRKHGRSACAPLQDVLWQQRRRQRKSTQAVDRLAEMGVEFCWVLGSMGNAGKRQAGLPSCMAAKGKRMETIQFGQTQPGCTALIQGSSPPGDGAVVGRHCRCGLQA